MKGLLLKDLYIMKKYYKSYLIIIISFFILSVVIEGNLFFVFYPCVLCGVIPIGLLNFDERSRWSQYSCTLPYTKKQLVSSKYLIGLMAEFVVIVFIAIIQGVKMTISGNFSFGNLGVLMLLAVIVSSVGTSFSMPFVFRSGVAKGQIAYYFTIGVVCAASFIISGFFKEKLSTEIKPDTLLIVLATVSVLVYIFSWYISIVFYKKREIQ